MNKYVFEDLYDQNESSEKTIVYSIKSKNSSLYSKPQISDKKKHNMDSIDQALRQLQQEAGFKELNVLQQANHESSMTKTLSAIIKEPRSEMQIQSFTSKNSKAKQNSMTEEQNNNNYGHEQKIKSITEFNNLSKNSKFDVLSIGFSQPQSSKTYKVIPTKIFHSQINQRKKLVNRALAPNRLIFANLIRDKSGLNLLSPQYHLYSEDNTYLLSAKKRIGCKTSNYILSIDKDDLNAQSKNCIGKIRSNFFGTVFNIFTPGCNPKDADKYPDKIVRELIATIYYQSEKVKEDSPRALQVYILNQRYNYFSLQGAIQHEQIDLRYLYGLEGNQGRISKLINRKPVWDPNRKIFVLNFHGKIHKNSVKNMILMRQDDEQDVFLFTKFSDQKYHLEIAHPLSLRVAMGILMSSFDFKLKVE